MCADLLLLFSLAIIVAVSLLAFLTHHDGLAVLVQDWVACSTQTEIVRA